MVQSSTECQTESKLQSSTFLSFSWSSLLLPFLSFSLKVTSSLDKAASVAASSPASLAAAAIDKQSQSLLSPGPVGFHRDVTSLRSSQLHLVPVTSSSTEGGCEEMLPAGGWHDGWVAFRLWSMRLPLTLLPICCLFFMGIINNAVLLAHRFWHKGNGFRQTHWNGWSKLGSETGFLQAQSPSKYTNPSFPRAYKETLLLHSPLLSSIRTLVVRKMLTHTSLWGQRVCVFFCFFL